MKDWGPRDASSSTLLIVHQSQVTDISLCSAVLIYKVKLVLIYVLEAESLTGYYCKVFSMDHRAFHHLT